MALQLVPDQSRRAEHACVLPWPVDPEIPEGHVCECGKRWVYQPAHWSLLRTVQELRRQQQAGDFARGVVPASGPRHPRRAVADSRSLID